MIATTGTVVRVSGVQELFLSDSTKGAVRTTRSLGSRLKSTIAQPPTASLSATIAYTTARAGFSPPLALGVAILSIASGIKALESDSTTV